MDAAERIVFIDTETTGVDEKDQVIEVAVVRLDGHVLLDTRVFTSTPINPVAQSIHHISQEDLTGAPKFAAVWQQQLKPIFQSAKTVFAWNAAFDSRLLIQSGADAALVASKMRCMMLDYQRLFRLRRWPKLTIALRNNGIDFCPKRMHGALEDATKTAELYRVAFCERSGRKKTRRLNIKTNKITTICR